MKVLIVDDSKAMRSIVRRTIRQAGFSGVEVVEAENGKEGLAQMSECPDVVFSDWNMPEMNGIEFLKALREENINTTFGFVTSEGTAEMRKSAREAGAHFFIVKPFTPEIFGAALTGILS